MVDYFDLIEYYSFASSLKFLLIIISYAQSTCGGVIPYEFGHDFTLGVNTFYIIFFKIPVHLSV